MQRTSSLIQSFISRWNRHSRRYSSSAAYAYWWGDGDVEEHGMSRPVRSLLSPKTYAHIQMIACIPAGRPWAWRRRCRRASPARTWRSAPASGLALCGVYDGGVLVGRLGRGERGCVSAISFVGERPIDPRSHLFTYVGTIRMHAGTHITICPSLRPSTQAANIRTLLLDVVALREEELGVPRRGPCWVGWVDWFGCGQVREEGGQQVNASDLRLPSQRGRYI